MRSKQESLSYSFVSTEVREEHFPCTQPHAHGVFSPEADSTLEAIDGMVALLAQQEFANNSEAVPVIVSGHGFMNISHYVNLFVPFWQAGLIQGTINPAARAPVVSSWKAEPSMAGGMAAIRLYNASASATEQPVPGTRGSHGFSPEYPEMRASFFAVGAGIAHHRDLGVVDMRQIAPTIAKILHVPLPTAKATPLHVQP